MPVISPAYPKNNVPIVFSSDDNFLACTAVAVRSILRHASPERNYDIILLHNGIPDARLAPFTELAAAEENISIRCFNTSPLMQNRDFFVSNRPGFSETTFYRLGLPWLLSEYNKVLYLDGDTVTLTDVAQLFDTDVDGYLLAAAPDICGQGGYFRPDGLEAHYRRDILKMSDPELYFNSGVLVINCSAFRSRFTMETVLDKATAYKWKTHDQDVLNSLCSGNVHWLPLSWNFIEVMWGKEFLPERYLRMFNEARRAPLLYHYASDLKPWVMSFPDSHLLFWETALDTPYFRELMRKPKLSSSMIELLREPEAVVAERYYNGQVGFRYILKFIRGWASFKLTGAKTSGR